MNFPYWLLEVNGINSGGTDSLNWIETATYFISGYLGKSKC